MVALVIVSEDWEGEGRGRVDMTFSGCRGPTWV